MSPELMIDLCRRSPNELSQRECLLLVQRLGNLAYWWLQPAVLAKADQRLLWSVRKRLEPRSNGCAILFAQDQSQKFPVFREAFLLPLCWQWKKEDDGRLPACVLQLANTISQQLQNRGDFNQWGLQLAVDLGNTNCLHILADGLRLSPDSGWAWLCASLIVAEQIRQTQLDGLAVLPQRHDVWISAAWNESHGIESVGYLDAKVRAASDPESGVRALFLPEENVERAKKLLPAQSQLCIRGLPKGNDPFEVLRECLLELDTPPQPDANKQELQAYYERIYRRDNAYAKQYYREQLLPRIIARLRQQWQQTNRTITHLVTILSDNPELVRMAIESTGASECLVLATEEKFNENELDELKKTLQCPCRIDHKVFQNPDNLLQHLGEKVKMFVQAVAFERVGLDLTPGTKEMTLTLALQVAEPGNQLLYLRHERKGQMVVPFSEQWVIYNNPRRPGLFP